MLDLSTMNNTQILENLKEQNSDALRSVCFEAGKRGLIAALPLLVQHVQSENLGIQEAAEFALRSIRGEATVDTVILLLRDESAPVRNVAMDILREIGSDHVLSLVKLMHDEDADIRIFSADILGTTDSLLAMSALCESLLSDENVNVRYQSATSLGTLGFAGAAPTLHLALKDEEWVQFATIGALASIKDDSCIDILIDDLDTVSPLVAAIIINALGEMDNIKAAPILLSRLDTLSEALRNKAVKAIIQILGVSSLGYLGTEALKRFHLYLIDAIDDTDEDIVQAALTGLSVLASEEGATAVLRYAKKLDPMRDADRIFAVIDCLSSIGSVDALATGLLSNFPAVVGCCIEACGKIGDKQSVEALYAAFWQMDCEQQRITSKYLLDIADATFTPNAIDILNRHNDSHVINSILLFLGRKVRAVEVAPLLFAHLDHPFDDVKEVALLACLGLQDISTNKQLVAFANSEDPLKRLMGIHAMGQIDVNMYFAKLADALTDPLPDIRKTALQALAFAGTEHPKCLSLITACLKDEDRDVRTMATESMQMFSPEIASPFLFEVLNDTDPWIRIRAIEAFEYFNMIEAVPVLVAGLGQPDVLVVLKIIKTLGVIGGDIAFHALLDLANHENPDIQQAAAAALEHMRDEMGETF